MKLLAQGILFIFIFTGCSSVISDVTVFHTLPKLDTNNSLTYKFEKLKWQENNLEFDNYQSKTQDYLSKVQFIQNDNSNNIVQINYGIGNGVDRQDTRPLMGVVGYNSNGVPSYGVIGVATDNSTYYKRFFYLTITDKERGRLIYDGRALSVGESSQLLAVIDEMLEALFQDFPGQSGKTKSVEISFKK